MAHFNFVISQNAKWGHAGFYIDCHQMTVPENIILQKKHWAQVKFVTNRQTHSDLILTYRILVDVCVSDYFQLMSFDVDRTVTRGNPFKLGLSVNYCRTNTRRNFLANVLWKFGTVIEAIEPTQLRHAASVPIA